MQTENDTTKPEYSPQQEAGEGCSGATCSASLVWHAGPAQGGGGTAQDEMPQDHGYSSWWADGELLLVLANTNSGPKVSLVRVSADGDQLGFYDPETGDDDWGWMDTDISWWARVMESLPQNS